MSSTRNLRFLSRLPLLTGLVCICVGGLFTVETGLSKCRKEAPLPLVEPASSPTVQSPANSNWGSEIEKGLPARLEGGVNMDCNILNWTTEGGRPTLSLDCQPFAKSSPFRMYITLSWMKFASQPTIHPAIIARPKTPAKFHSDSRGAFVWLTLRSADDGKLRSGWVRFSELVCLRIDSRHPACEPSSNKQARAIAHVCGSKCS